MFDKKLLNNGQKYPFKIISDERNNKFKFEIDQDNVYYPEEITAIVLNNIKEFAEKKIGNKIENAVISVPASFNDSQRQSTIDAAKIAGFKTIRLLNDTTAAAIAYSYDKSLEDKKKIMVFDLGGHFLNLSIVNIENGIVEVQSAFSVPELGGQTFDFRMAQYLEKKIKEDSNKDISQNMKAYQSLLVECEIAKKNLSNALESFHKISFDYGDIKFKFTRDLFERLNKELFDTIINHVDDFIGDLKLKLSDIDEVLIIGGSSRIPKLQSMLSVFFDGKKLNYTMNASETVAYGASIQAAFLTGNKLKYNSGFKYVDLINRNSVLKILHNHEELFDIFMPAKTQLLTSQFASIKKALLKKTLTLEFKENNITINTLDIDYGHLNQVDINFNIDLNGIFSIILAKFDQNDIQKKCKIMLNKVSCLSNDQIEKLKDNQINYLKFINEKNKKLALKNKLETKCYDLKIKIASKDENKSGKYSEIEKDINRVLEYLISSDINELNQVNESISKILESYYKLNFKFEFESKLIVIQTKYYNLKNEITSKDELKSNKYSVIEIDLDKFIENIKLKFDTGFNDIVTILGQKFEKIKNFRSKHEHEQELLVIDQNYDEYVIIEKEIDNLLENLASELKKELIDFENFINSKKNDLIDLQNKTKLISEISKDFEDLINSIELSEKLENESQNKDIVENLDAIKTSMAINIQASNILDFLKKYDNSNTIFKNVEKGLSDLLNDMKKKDSKCIKSLEEQLKVLKLEFIMEQKQIEYHILKDIKNMFDSWNSKYKLKFVTDLLEIIKMRENNQISKDNFCQSIEQCFQENIGSLGLIDMLKVEFKLKKHLNNFKKSSY
jgi:heat shock protein 1/8